MDKIDYSSLAKDLKYLDRAIPREKWLNTNLTPRMTEVFLCYFESSRILFTIRLADTELHIIEVMVKTIHSYQSEFTDIIHRSMPYPVLLFQNFKGKFFQVSVVESHTNKYNTCREVVDQRSSSRWVERNKYDYLLRLISKSIPSFTSRSSFLATISQLLEDFNKEIRFENAINEAHPYEMNSAEFSTTCSEMSIDEFRETCSTIPRNPMFYANKLNLVVQRIEALLLDEENAFVDELYYLQSNLEHEIQLWLADSSSFDEDAELPLDNKRYPFDCSRHHELVMLHLPFAEPLREAIRSFLEYADGIDISIQNRVMLDETIQYLEEMIDDMERM